MLGLNTTGSANNKQYLLGRACVFVSDLDAAGAPLCYRNVGNTPDFTVSIDVEEVSHRASLCTGIGSGAVVDANLVIERTMNIGMTLEEFSDQNFGLFAQATLGTVANPAVVGRVSWSITTSAALNCWYALQDAAGIRFLALVQDADVTVTRDPGGTPVLLVQGVDYDLDLKSAMVLLIEGGAALAGDEIAVVVIANAAALPNIDQTFALKAPEANVAVKVILENLQDGGAQFSELEFHSVRLAADGDAALVSDEFAQMTLTGVAQFSTFAQGTMTTSRAVAA